MNLLNYGRFDQRSMKSILVQYLSFKYSLFNFSFFFVVVKTV